MKHMRLQNSCCKTIKKDSLIDINIKSITHILHEAKPRLTRTYLSVVGHKEGGGAVVLHEVFGEEADPGVISVENYPHPRCLGLPNEVVFQQGRRI